jgi:hypothetical protein
LERNIDRGIELVQTSEIEWRIQWWEIKEAQRGVAILELSNALGVRPSLLGTQVVLEV